MVKVEVLKSARLNGRDVPVGEVVEIEDSLLSYWITKGIAKLPKAEGQITQSLGNSDSGSGEGPLTLEQFGALTAAEQKSELARLQIEGDAGNDEKRATLYTAFLESLNGGDGSENSSETGGAASSGAGDNSGSQNVSAD